MRTSLIAISYCHQDYPALAVFLYICAVVQGPTSILLVSLPVHFLQVETINHVVLHRATAEKLHEECPGTLCAQGAPRERRETSRGLGFETRRPRQSCENHSDVTMRIWRHDADVRVILARN